MLIRDSPLLNTEPYVSDSEIDWVECGKYTSACGVDGYSQTILTKRKVIYLKTMVPKKTGGYHICFDKIPRTGKAIQAITSYKLMIKKFAEFETDEIIGNNQYSVRICHLLKYQELLQRMWNVDVGVFSRQYFRNHASEASLNDFSSIDLSEDYLDDEE